MIQQINCSVPQKSDHELRARNINFAITEPQNHTNHLSELKTGNKRYELTNHLGNILAVITDRKIPKFDNVNSTFADYYDPVVLSATDYYPFGMEMPGRTMGGYRYGFNGKEKDTEGEWGTQTHYDYGFRIYEPGIGRFLSLDPLTKSYPSWTPYVFAMNRVIDGVDLDGAEYLRADKTTVDIRYGAVSLKIENLSLPSKNSIYVSANYPGQYGVANYSKGTLGVDLTLSGATFELVTDPIADVNLTGVDNTLGAPDPLYNPGIRSIKPKNTGTPTSAIYDYASKTSTKVGKKTKTSWPASSFRNVSGWRSSRGRSVLIIDAINFGLAHYIGYLKSRDRNRIKMHGQAAFMAIEDVSKALSLTLNGEPMIPEYYRNLKDLSEIANVVLQGADGSSDSGIVEIGMTIWLNVSSERNKSERNKELNQELVIPKP